MKRDMNLVRAILLEVENACLKDTLNSEYMNLDGWDKDEIKYHCKLMIEHGLLEGQISKELGLKVPYSFIIALTWEGHDFLDACRDENRWKKAQALFKAVGDVSFDVMKTTLSSLATDAIKSLLLR